MKIDLRYQEIEDAERFYEILNNPNFLYFQVKPESIEAEIEFLQKNEEKRNNNFEYNFSVICDDKLVGGAGIKIDQHRNYIGEIGYFIDEEYWGKGIATEVVRQLEKYGFDKLGLNRIEILVMPENAASVRVAEKNNYLREGLLKKTFLINKKFVDMILFSKIKE